MIEIIEVKKTTEIVRINSFVIIIMNLSSDLNMLIYVSVAPAKQKRFRQPRDFIFRQKLYPLLKFSSICQFCEIYIGIFLERKPKLPLTYLSGFRKRGAEKRARPTRAPGQPKNRFSRFTTPHGIVGPHLERPVCGFLVLLISIRVYL